MNTFISFPRFIKREPREEAVSPQRIAIGSVAISFDSRNPDAPPYNTRETINTDDYACALLVSDRGTGDRKRGTSESGHDSRKRRQSEIAETLNENISLPFPIVISYLPGISYLKFEIEGISKVRAL